MREVLLKCGFESPPPKEQPLPLFGAYRKAGVGAGSS